MIHCEGKSVLFIFTRDGLRMHDVRAEKPPPNCARDTAREHTQGNICANSS